MTHTSEEGAQIFKSHAMRGVVECDCLEPSVKTAE